MMHDYDYEMAQAAHDMQARLETDIGTLVDERDEARAQLANAAASEVDAVQGRQECERELREARRERLLLAEALIDNLPTVIKGEVSSEVLELAHRIVWEDGQ